MDEDFKVGEVGGQDYVFKTTREIYKFHSPPYVIVGTSGKGKTTLCLDILHTFAGECNSIYFITNTKASLAEDDLKQVPQFCIRDPGEDPIGVISSVWSDIRDRFASVNASMQDINAVLSRLYPNTEIVNRVNRHLSSMEPGEKQNIARIELIRNLIIRKVKTNPQIMTSLTDAQRNIVRSFISVNQKAILILDDVSESIMTASATTNKRASGANVLSGKNLFKSVLLEIFTRVRHYNCLCCIFIHDLSLLEQVKSQLGTICLMDNSVLTTYSNMHSLPSNGRDAAVQVESSLHILSKFKYHYLMVDSSTGTVNISKAALHKTEMSIPVAPIMRKIHSIYAKIEGGESLERRALPAPATPYVPPVVSKPAEEESPQSSTQMVNVEDFL